MSTLRSRMRVALWAALLFAAAAVIWGPGARPVAAGSTVSVSVWMQTMDSCKEALGSARYQVVGDNGVDVQVTTPSSSPVSVGSGNCPVPRGNCSSTTAGCVQIHNLPPGRYRIHELVTPPGNSSNPEGYAACNGGSACQRQEMDVTVSSSGSVSANTTNVYPDGTVAVYPTGSTFKGTASDPLLVHNFGLAKPGSQGAECDGDGDADDHSTGTPSSHCAYPENQESSACKPFPWSCTLDVWPAPVVTTTTSTTTTADPGSSTTTTDSTTTTTDTTTTTTDTTTTDTTTTDTTTTSSTTTSTAGPACTLSTTSNGKLKKGSTKKISFTEAAVGPLSVDASWSGTGTVRLQVLDHNSKVVAQTTVTGTSIHLDFAALSAGKYTLSLKLSGTRSVTYTLAASHC